MSTLTTMTSGVRTHPFERFVGWPGIARSDDFRGGRLSVADCASTASRADLEWAIMTTPDDDELRDDALADEITLVGELIVAASASDGPLTPDEVDEALGVRRCPSVSTAPRPAVTPG